ncbi:PTS transporter subunit EIIC [Erysipelatoclostridium ramosum]|uniref:PTS sugar transporter subunit IIC n=1 Tax=Thomasclavelia ramosa TaxID=1547 RepID=UPI00192BE713|nr:PTS transporter subunit EIIC [Thomasclavelia ramosa]MCR1946549.1 PTS transporter subunit EIIC [Thomasclavelia ramosa]QQY26218.1 PTS sugar transporter subunit IIC [Thomasclavelia ramosa]
MEKLEKLLNRFIGPIAKKMSENDTIQSVAEGFMRTGPVTFGVCIFVILGNLPFTGYSDWLTNVGLKVHFDAISNASLNILALYVSFTVAHSFAKRKGDNALSCGILSLLSFLIIIPQTVAGVEGDITAFDITYLGGTGILVALIFAIIVGHLFHYLAGKGLKFKMPEGVPPMVSESFEPIFISMIIVTFAFVVRVGFGYTPFGNFLSFFDQTIGAFIIKIGLSLPTIFLLYFVANLLWFFGIHPNTVYSAFVPLQMTLIMTNIADAQAGKPLTYLTITLVSLFASFGGNGNTLGLCLSMFTARSERYKKMLKLAFIPNLFNINEPLIFGMPVMLNPVFFIPMVFCNVVMGFIGLFATQIFTFTYNPAMSLLPWTTPFFVKAFLAGGISLLIMVLILLVVNTLMYYPFFRIADKKAYEEEQLAKVGGKIE